MRYRKEKIKGKIYKYNIRDKSGLKFLLVYFRRFREKNVVC